jgi:hypothetical protein
MVEFFSTGLMMVSYLHNCENLHSRVLDLCLLADHLDCSCLECGVRHRRSLQIW